MGEINVCCNEQYLVGFNNILLKRDSQVSDVFLFSSKPGETSLFNESSYRLASRPVAWRKDG